MVVASLLGELGFSFKDKELKSFEKGMKSAAKSLAVVATATAAVGAGIFAFVEKIASSNDEVGKFSQRIGIATADLQAWQYAAELGGGSASSMSSSLENLSKTASEAARGIGGGVEVFGMLGISATDANGQIKNTSLLMEEVADRVSQLGTQSEKLEFLNKLGISSDLLLSLEQGSEALRKQRVEAELLGFTLDKNATQKAANFNDELNRVFKIIQGVSSAIATNLMPMITNLMKAFKSWFIVNKELINQNLKAFFEGLTRTITSFFNIATRVWNVIDEIVTLFGGWKVALGAATAAMLYFNASAMLIPLLFIAIGAAIFLLLEDITMYFKGGQSALGDLINDFPLLGVAVQSIADVVMMVIDGWKLMFSEGDKALEGLGLLIDKWLIRPIQTVIDKIAGIGTAISDITGGAIDATVGAFEGTKNFFGLGEEKLNPNTVTPSNNSNVNSNQTNNIEVKIEAAGGNPELIKQGLKEVITNTMSEMNKQASQSMASPIKS